MASVKDVLDMAMGFQKTQVLYTATSLGIFEVLNDSKLPMTASKVANRLHLDPDATERLLNACSGLALIDKSCNCNGTAIYKNSPCSQMFLSKSSPRSIRPFIAKIGDLYTIFGRLKDGIKEGQSQFVSSGNSGGSGGHGCFAIGDGFYSNEEKTLEFLETMHLFSSHDAPAAVRAFDLSQFQTACDLGGGTGALGRELATTYPHMDVTVADLSHILPITRHFISKSNSPINLRLASCDFFEDDLVSCDLYILSHVIHDWDDEHLEILLKKVYQAIRHGGALIVLEKVLNEKKDGPLVTLIFDLGMLISAGGRERTAIEYTELFKKHGFVNIEIQQMPETHYRDVILAWKPEDNYHEN